MHMDSILSYTFHSYADCIHLFHFILLIFFIYIYFFVFFSLHNSSVVQLNARNYVYCDDDCSLIPFCNCTVFQSILFWPPREREKKKWAFVSIVFVCVFFPFVFVLCLQHGNQMPQPSWITNGQCNWFKLKSIFFFTIYWEFKYPHIYMNYYDHFLCILI